MGSTETKPYPVVLISAERLANMSDAELYAELGFEPSEDTAAGPDAYEDTAASPQRAASTDAPLPAAAGLAHGESAASQAPGLNPKLVGALVLVNAKLLKNKALLEARGAGLNHTGEGGNKLGADGFLSRPVPLAESVKLKGKALNGVIVTHGVDGHSSKRANSAIQSKRQLGSNATQQTGATVHTRSVGARPARSVRPYVVGDIVQALVLIYEWLPNGEPHCHARPGHIGHVEFVDADGFPDVRFERSGTATSVALEDIVHLGDMHTGR